MLKKRRLILFIAIALLAALLGINFFFASPNSDVENVDDITLKINHVIDDFDKDYIALLMNNRPDKQVSFRTLNIPTDHPFYLFTVNGRLLYWSSITMVPDFEDIDLKKKYQIIDTQNGLFFVKLRKITRLGQMFWMVQTYSLYDKVDVQNEYLKAGENPHIFGNDRFILSSEKSEGYHDVYKDGEEYLFSILLRTGYEDVGHDSGKVVLVFFFSLVGLVLILGSDFVSTLWRKGKRVLALFYTAIIVVSIRAIMIFFHFPHEYVESELFNPSSYASSEVNPSLGDLLLNVIAIMVMLSLLVIMLSKRHYLISFFAFKRKYKEWLFHVACFFLSTILLVLFFNMFSNIVDNAQWELNVLSIPDFGYLQAISLFIIFLGGAGYLLFTIIAINMVLYRNKSSKKAIIQSLIIFALPISIGLAYLNLVYLIVFLAHIILLVSIIIFKLYENIFKLGFNTFLTFFFGCLIGAIITGAAAYQDNRIKEIQSKIRYADQLMVESDIMAEFLLMDVMSNIEADTFIAKYLTETDPADLVEQKIKKVYMSNYFDQYDLNIQVFNALGEKMNGKDGDPPLEDFRYQYMKSDYSTSVRNLYYIRNTAEAGGNKFYSFVSIHRGNYFLGTILLELVQQRVQPGSVFPKLLLDQEYAVNFYAEKFDYAIYDKDGVLKTSTGVYNYRSPLNEDLLDNSNLFTTGIFRGNNHHYGVIGENKIIVVSSSIYPSNYVFADVSLFFVAYLLYTLLCIMFYSVLQGIGKLQFNYTTQLQFYINFAFFFPMLIISIISIGLLTSSYTNDLHRQYFSKASIIRNNLSSYLENRSKWAIDEEDFTAEVKRLAGTTGTDINVYSPNGKLMVTNQPNIFDKKVLSEYLNPVAVSEILEIQNNRLILDEKAGKLTYKTVYIALRDNERQSILGIIAIPFFESETELNLVIADVFSNIINIFVVIFIVFLVVSFFVSKQLIYPFKLLTEKLKSTNLDSNEPMYWPAKDEIGLLVSEYNNMLFKLEASKKVLASTEKESAWREMAKQVAHEIKNPLTPMKLTLQHMLRLQSAGKLDDPKLISKPVESLIIQVDTLSEIANSFSTFAKMPLPKNEPIDFKCIVSEAVELFMNNEKAEVIFHDKTGMENVFIIGDDKLLGRIISNLIINGMQAAPTGRSSRVKVSLTHKAGHVKLEIYDNGKGIPDDLKEKIFMPNFSTKSEGSGLGLAIARRGVETAGGRIWFVTKINVGTSFFLSFPITK